MSKKNVEEFVGFLESASRHEGKTGAYVRLTIRDWPYRMMPSAWDHTLEEIQPLVGQWVKTETRPKGNFHNLVSIEKAEEKDRKTQASSSVADTREARIARQAARRDAIMLIQANHLSHSWERMLSIVMKLTEAFLDYAMIGSWDKLKEIRKRAEKEGRI